jgi:hypothetical protein
VLKDQGREAHANNMLKAGPLEIGHQVGLVSAKRSFGRPPFRFGLHCRHKCCVAKR